MRLGEELVRGPAEVQDQPGEAWRVAACSRRSCWALTRLPAGCACLWVKALQGELTFPLTSCGTFWSPAGFAPALLGAHTLTGAEAGLVTLGLPCWVRR